MEDYPYQALSEHELTRVVVVEPGIFNEELRCSLRTIPKQRLSPTSVKDADLPLGERNSDLIVTGLKHSRPENRLPGLAQISHHQSEVFASGDLAYNALSYVWGPPDLDAPVICDGKNCRITKNLDQALRRFRRPDERLHIWVDALCINQNDVVERSEQVLIMKQIYQRAEQVCIWLGDEGEESHLVLRLLEAHRRKARQPWFHVRTKFGPDAPEWAAMIRWLNRPWFWRVWTIQEARVAQCAVVYFGPHSINLAIVDKVLSLHISRDVNQNLAGHLREAFCLPGLSVRLSEYNTFGKRPSLLDLLLLSRRHQATDLRDKVYGLLGLVSNFSEQDLRNPLIRPNYNKTKEIVYRDTALFNVAKTSSLKIVQATYHGDEFVHHKDIPSWVPCWDQQDGPILLGERSWSSACFEEARMPVINLENGKYGVLSVDGTLEATVRVVLSNISREELWGRTDRGQATLFSHLWAELRHEYRSPVYLEGRHLILEFIEALTIGINGRGEFFGYGYEGFFITLHWMWGHVLDRTESVATPPMFCSDEPDEASDEEEYISESQSEDAVAQVPFPIDLATFSPQEIDVEPDQEDNASAMWLPDRGWSDDGEEALSEISAKSIRFDTGSCLLCRDPQEQNSTSSLHSYLMRNPNREELPGSETDVMTFQYRIKNFRGYQVKGPDLGFLAPCTDACSFRRFFITEDQCIGIGPQAMRAGDIITLLQGAAFPCVLRKAKMNLLELEAHIGKPGNFYHFIGECYIQGLDRPEPMEKSPGLVVFDLV